MRAWTQGFERDDRENIRINAITPPSGDQEAGEAEAVLLGLNDPKPGDLVCTVCNRIARYEIARAHIYYPYFTCECGKVWVLKGHESGPDFYSSVWWRAWELASPEP